MLVVNGSDSENEQSVRGHTSVKEQQLTESLGSAKTDSSSEAAVGSTIQDAIKSSTGYILPDSDSRYYSESELEAMTDYELYLARNEIYARYGREFKNGDLQDYFGNKDWYTLRLSADSFDSVITLNAYEKKNAETMLCIEKRRRSSYLKQIKS